MCKMKCTNIIYWGYFRGNLFQLITVTIGFLLEDSFQLEMISFSPYKMKKYLIYNSYIHMYLFRNMFTV